MLPLLSGQNRTELYPLRSPKRIRLDFSVTENIAELRLPTPPRAKATEAFSFGLQGYSISSGDSKVHLIRVSWNFVALHALVFAGESKGHHENRTGRSAH